MTFSNWSLRVINAKSSAMLAKAHLLSCMNVTLKPIKIARPSTFSRVFFATVYLWEWQWISAASRHPLHSYKISVHKVSFYSSCYIECFTRIKYYLMILCADQNTSLDSTAPQPIGYFGKPAPLSCLLWYNIIVNSSSLSVLGWNKILLLLLLL